MKRLLLGSRNDGKIAETKELLAGIEGLEFLTFADCPFSEVEETGSTFVENALLKAASIVNETGLAVLAEDAGLEVAALDHAPGVRSARFSGEPADTARNNRLLIERLEGASDRRARFVSVAALWLHDGQVFVCTGVLSGIIATAPAGTGGFGYDPLFIPDGGTKTLAQMVPSEKNRISHRRRAMGRMRGLLIDLAACGELSG